MKTSKILLFILIFSLAVLTGCGEKDSASNKSSYDIAMKYFENNDYENALTQFEKTLSEGFNDEDGKIKSIIGILENYIDAEKYYDKKEYADASEKIYGIKDYEIYPIKNDVDKLRENIDTGLKSGDEKSRVILLSDLTEKDVPKILENVKISTEQAEQTLLDNLDNKELSVEEIGEFDIIIDDTLWYYFHTYLEDEDEEAYYISSKTGEIREYEVFD